MKLSFVRNSRYVLFAAVALVALAILVSGGIITSNLLMGQTRATYESQGAYFGTLYNDAEPTVFMKVNNYDVTYPEYVIMKAEFETNMANQRARIDSAVPPHEWNAPEGAAQNDPARPLPDFMITDEFKKMAETMEKHGSDAGALGALILQYAEYSRAVEAGYDWSDAEVEAAVATLKAQYADNVLVSEAGQLGEVKGYLSVVGEDVFWGTIFPRTVRQANAIKDWRRAMFVDSEGNYLNNKAQNRIRLANNTDMLSKVRVEVTDRSLLKATPEQGKAYLNEVLPFIYPVE